MWMFANLGTQINFLHKRISIQASFSYMLKAYFGLTLHSSDFFFSFSSHTCTHTRRMANKHNTMDQSQQTHIDVCFYSATLPHGQTLDIIFIEETPPNDGTSDTQFLHICGLLALLINIIDVTK